MAEKIVRGEKKDAPAKKAAEPAKKAAAPAKKETAPAKKPQQTVVTPNKPTGGSTAGLRIGACVLWVVAIVCEVFAVMALMKDFSIRFSANNPQTNVILTLVLFLVIDLACCIAAAQLWKKANRIKPMSGKNKFLFYLWAEMGLIMLAICFVPVIIALFKSTKLDKKTKTITIVLALVAVLIAGLFSADWNPITAEQKEEAEAQITQSVFWTQFGHKYHLNMDEESGCPYIRNSSTVYQGSVTEAIETGRTSICSYCAAHYAEELGLNLEALNVEEGVESPADETVPAATVPVTAAP